MRRQPKVKLSSLPSPIKADELIRCLRTDLSDEAAYLIRRLAAERLTIKEIIAELIAQGFRQQMPDESALVKQIHDTRYKKLHHQEQQRHGKVFGHWHGEWYVFSSVADPKIAPPIKYGNAKLDAGRSQFVSITEDILKHSPPLTLGQLIEGVMSHPQYQGPKKPLSLIRTRVDNAIRHNDWLFEKKLDRRGLIPDRYARWGLVGEIKKPSRRVPQKDILYREMRGQKVIKGWTLDELVCLVQTPELGFGYCQKADEDCVKAFLISRLRAKNETRFQRLGTGYQVRYRALPIGRTKIPSTPADWDLLVNDICRDLRLDHYETIEEGARKHAYLFGWDTLLLPSALITNEVYKALDRRLNPKKQ